MIYGKSFSKGRSRQAKIYVDDFSNGMTSLYQSKLIPLHVATRSFNTEFKSGALTHGFGIKNARYNGVEIASFSVEDVEAKALYYFKAFNENKGLYDDYLLVYGSDGYIYKLLLGVDGNFSKVEELQFDERPSAVNYNYAGKDVVIFSQGNLLKVFDGDQTISVNDAPGITSSCIHNERLFAIEGGEKISLWFSDDFNPLNWNVSLEDAGYIDLRDGRGSLIKVVSFGGYLYVFRNYGITRITAFGDQRDFSVDGVTSSSSKICADSIAVCGDRVIYLASDGFYSFAGSSPVRILERIDEMLSEEENKESKGCYFNGNYFCTLYLKDENGEKFQALIKYDLSTGDFTLSRNLNLVDYAVLEGEEEFKLFFLCADNRSIGELSSKSEYFGRVLKKSWKSGENDFGIKQEKRLVKLYLSAETRVTVKIKSERDERVLYFEGGKKKQSLPIGLKGEYFSFLIECDLPTCFVNYFCVEFEYER